MEKTIVIYKSISGFTKKYAHMIGSQLNSKVIPIDKVKDGLLKDYDVIIYGGSLHATGIIGIKDMKKALKKTSYKRFVVFATGASPHTEELIKEIEDNNFTEDKPSKIFYLRGGFNFKKLDFPNKVAMFIFINFLKLKSKKTPDEKGMISAYRKPVDFTNKNNMANLISYLKKCLARK